MTLRNTLIVGLASDRFGNELTDALQHVTGGTNAITVGATNVRVGVSGGSLGFFGAAVTSRPAVAQGNATSAINALANLGLITVS